MPSTTRLALKYAIWRAFAHEDEVLEGFGVPFNTSGLAGSTSTVVDTSLTRGTTGGTNTYDARQVEIVELETGGPAIGEVSWVTNGGFASNTLTVSPAFSLAVKAGTDYILWPRGLTQALVEDEITRVLENTEGPHFWIPSMVPDPSFELDTSVLATYWPDVGAPTTTDWDTTAANILFGGRCIKVVASAADTGVQSQPFDVTEGEQLLISVIARCTVDSLKVELYNETAGTVLESVTVDERTFTEIRFTYTVPDNMEQARLRFLGTAATSEFYIGAPVVVQSTSPRAYPGPSWLVDKQMVLSGFYVPQGYASEANDSYLAGGRRWGSAALPEFVVTPRDVTPLWIRFAGNAAPLGFLCYRPFAALSTDSATTFCDKDYIVNKVIANIRKNRGEHKYRQYKDDGPGWGQYAVSAASRARARGYGQRDLRIVPNPMVVG